MTDFQEFKKKVQTYGSRPFLKTAEPAYGGAYALVLAEEKALDDRLDAFEAPFNPELTARLMKTIVTERNARLFFLFFRHSAWLSVLLMLCGFYFGYHEAMQSYANTTSYFNDMFDLTLNATELYQ